MKGKRSLTAGPDAGTEALRRRPEWTQARAGVGVMESGKLTSRALAHVHELPGGIVVE